MSMGPAAGDEAVPYINVTPLIDVLLVLLIIFMVVTPLKPSRFEAKIPSEPDKTQEQQLTPNPLTLVVTIYGDFKLTLNGKEMGSTNDTGGLSSTLAELFEKRKQKRTYRPNSDEVETTVFIKAPASLKYGEVVKVIDAIKGAGAKPVGLQVDGLDP